MWYQEFFELSNSFYLKYNTTGCNIYVSLSHDDKCNNKNIVWLSEFLQYKRAITDCKCCSDDIKDTKTYEGKQ